MNNLPDMVLGYLISLLSPFFPLLPSVVLILAIWRVARLRSLTLENYQERVDENVADTLKEQICHRFLSHSLRVLRSFSP